MKKKPNKNLLVKQIVNCARCGKNHPILSFVPFARSFQNMTHWAICPISGDPILLRITKFEETNEARNQLEIKKFAADFDEDSNWYAFPAEMWDEFQVLAEDYGKIKEMRRKFKKYEVKDITKLRFENPTEVK